MPPRVALVFGWLCAPLTAKTSHCTFEKYDATRNGVCILLQLRWQIFTLFTDLLLHAYVGSQTHQVRILVFYSYQRFPELLNNQVTILNWKSTCMLMHWTQLWHLQWSIELNSLQYMLLNQMALKQIPAILANNLWQRAQKRVPWNLLSFNNHKWY